LGRAEVVAPAPGFPVDRLEIDSDEVFGGLRERIPPESI
jgi:hypothetical protein